MSRTASFAVFLSVAAILLGGVHFYLWARLVRDPQLSDAWRRALGAALLAAFVLTLPAIILGRLFPSLPGRIAARVAYVWLGTSFLLFAALALADGVRLLAAASSWITSLWRADPPPDPERRLLLARAVAGTAVLAAGGAAGFGLRSALGDPEVHEVPVRLERLPRALSGLSIAQLSDLHVGNALGERQVARAVELTNRLRPDLVAITGDLVDGDVDELRAATGHLARLKARYGVFFVTGNHEYYQRSAYRDWLDELRRYGIHSLENERVQVGDAGPGGASIDLAGVNDWSAPTRHRMDLPAALAGRDPERSLVLLAHQPREFGDSVRAGVELQLSGHTHGGQLFPWSLVVGAVFPYLKGLHRHQEGERQGQIFVSRGTGFWGPPLRLGSPPEIARLVLTT